MTIEKRPRLEFRAKLWRLNESGVFAQCSVAIVIALLLLLDDKAE